jgi:hypothetical protein
MFKRLACWILSLIFPFRGPDGRLEGDQIGWREMKSQEYRSAHAGISSDFDIRKE